MRTSGRNFFCVSVLLALATFNLVADPVAEVAAAPTTESASQAAAPSPEAPIAPVPESQALSGGSSTFSAHNVGLVGGSQAGASDQALNFQTDLFTGRFTYEVPIIVPPARQGTAPRIALGYNSGSGNSWCGVGWNLDMGFIQRETRKGVPRLWDFANHLPENKYDDSKGFTVSFQGVNSRLVNVGGTEYRAEVDHGSFLKFVYVNPYWEVTDKNGTKFYFGEAGSSRMENAAFSGTNGQNIFRWAINRIRDANGNETHFTYTTDQGQLYLSQVSYNANVNSPTISATHTVDFSLETRVDDVAISFASGYRVTTAKRLKEIIVKIGSTKVRRYALTYASSASTYRALLTTLTQYGADDTSTLPPLTFNYQVQQTGFENLSDWSTLYSNGQTGVDWNSIRAIDGNGNTHVDVIDMDGDGLPDRVMQKNGTTFATQRNTGSGFTNNTSNFDWITVDDQGGDETWQVPFSFDSGVDAKCTMMDINGDGLPDRVVRRKNSPYNAFKVQLNTGTGFGTMGSWGEVFNQGDSGAGWNSPISCSTSDTNGTVVDINGDGLPDRVSRKIASPFTNYIVQFNLGTNFIGTNSFVRWTNVANEGGTSNEQNWNSVTGINTADETLAAFLDINGDGLPDRVMRKRNSPYNKFVIQYNNGAAFETWDFFGGTLNSQGRSEPGWNSPRAESGDDVYTTLVDINGDGLPDRVMRKYASSYTNFFVQINTGSAFATNLVSWANVSGQNSGSDWNSVTAVNSNNDTHVDFFDINGDGLPDRVLRKINTPYNKFMVQLNKGPFPDLLSTVQNGVGGKVDVVYKASTQVDNRDRTWTGDPWTAGAKSLLPFNVWTVSTITTDDGMGNTAATTYTFKNGMFEPQSREFRGFNMAVVTDPLGTKTITYFHQGGGINQPTDGEFEDQASKAKKGMPYRTEVWGSDGLKYSQTLNKIEETQLHANGWYFGFVSQTIRMDYEAIGSYRAVAKQFQYDSNLNLTRESLLGEVTSVNEATHAFSDTANDSVYIHTAYATLSNADIKNRPSSVKVTSDSSGSLKLREILFSQYDQSRGNLKQLQAWINTTGGYATTSADYDQYGNPNSTTDPASITTTTTYDATYRTFPDTQTTGTFVSSATFDARSGQVLTTTDPKGLVSENTYDTFFRLTQSAISTTPNGAATLWRQKLDYTLGGISGGISSNSVRTRVFDAVDATNGHETWTYSDGLGRPIQTRSEAETGSFRVVDTFYNDRGQPELETLPIFSSGSAFTADSGQPGTAIEYDAVGRAFRITPPAGDTGSPTGAATVAFKDGSNPWVSVITDAEGKVRKAVEDAYGRTLQSIEVTSGGNFTTAFEFNLVGDLTKVTDHAANQTTMVYDSLGRKTSTTEPNMGTWSYDYDSASRLTRQTDAKGQKLDFFYNDELGRLKSKEVRNASNTLVATITYAYDTSDDGNYTVFKGQLYKVTDREGWQKHSYDFRDRLLKTGRNLSVNGLTYVTQSAYDEADRITNLLYPGDAAEIKYTYDTGGNLQKAESLSGTGANEVFYTAQGFNAIGQLTGITYGNGLATTFSYYANSKRPQQTQTTKLGGGYNQSLSYTFDKLSNIKSITDGIYSGTASAGLSGITYDDLYRLTSLTSVAAGTKNYSYSAIGNILTNGEFGGGTYVYGTSKPHAVTSANAKSYGYDGCGNMTNRNGQTLVYDEENQLKSVNSITFGYDDSGSRLWKNNASDLTVWIGGIYEEKGDKALCHVFAGGRRVATFEPIEEGASLIQNTPVLAQLSDGLHWLGTWPFDAGRAPFTIMLVPLVGILGISIWARRTTGEYSPRRTRRARRCFGFYPATLLYRQITAVSIICAVFFASTPQVNAVPTYDPVFYYYHGDHLGSSNVLTDRAGELVQHFESTAYGKEQFKANTQAFSVSNRYTDQILDEDTGLYYYNARYYDPELGRFIQADTIVPDPADPQAYNRYSYVNNNPLNFIDPSGHDPDTIAWMSLNQSGGSAATSDTIFFPGSASGSLAWTYQPMGFGGFPSGGYYSGGQQNTVSSATIRINSPRASQETMSTPKLGFLDSVLLGAVDGDYAEGDLGAGGLGAQIGVGFIPIAGQIADFRDTTAALRDLGNGGWKSGWVWAGVGVAAVAWVPGFDALKAVKPYLKKQAKLVKQLRTATGKGNDLVVKTQKEAEQLLEKARPEIPWRYTYEAPKPKIGKEIHPPDGSGMDLPHIKWRDWTKGKSGGAEGHIYFESPN